MKITVLKSALLGLITVTLFAVSACERDVIFMFPKQVDKKIQGTWMVIDKNIVSAPPDPQSFTFDNGVVTWRRYDLNGTVLQARVGPYYTNTTLATPYIVIGNIEDVDTTNRQASDYLEGTWSVFKLKKDFLGMSLEYQTTNALLIYEMKKQ